MSTAIASTMLAGAYGVLMLFMVVLAIAAHNAPKLKYISYRWLIGLGLGMIALIMLAVWVTMYVIGAYPAWWTGEGMIPAVCLVVVWTITCLLTALHALQKSDS